jgi:hypothetical protein
MALDLAHVSSTSPDPVRAVAELAEQIGHRTAEALVFFCTHDYDLDILGRELGQVFPGTTIGCTSSGHFGPHGFQLTGIVGVAFFGDALRITPFLITPLARHTEQVARIAEEVRALCDADPALNRFGLLLVDGLSMVEESLVGTLYQLVGNLPIIGGSAGDNLRFERTHVYAGDGTFLSDAALFALIETRQPVAAFKTQHFAPSDNELVITEADTGQRLIREMNGEPAALAYARAIGLPVEALTPSVFAHYPLVLTLGDGTYVRSIQKVNADLSMPCYCAIEEGLIVSIGQALDPVQTLSDALAAVRGSVHEPALILGCDCILRRLQFERQEISAAMSDLMAKNDVFGFFTYGEQFNGVHVNQTLTAVAIGG